MPVASDLDSHALSIAATVLGRGDVIVAISATGRTTDMLSATEMAIASGATVIAITASGSPLARLAHVLLAADVPEDPDRSEEHTSELQSLMRISYAGFCLKKKQTKHT